MLQLQSHAQTISVVMDNHGEDVDYDFHSPTGVTIANSGDVLVAARSHNAFRIDPHGVITEIIDATGDGNGNTLSFPTDILVDDAGNVYVAGSESNNVFKISPDGAINRIISATGDDIGHTLSYPSIALGNDGVVYVAGEGTNNGFKITPDGTITQIINVFGDLNENLLQGASGIAVDSQGNVYISGLTSDNVFKIRPNGTITQILDLLGDQVENILDAPGSLFIDREDNLYILGRGSNNVFKRSPAGDLSVIINSAGDGRGNLLDSPSAIDVDGDGNVYIAASGSNNVFRIDKDGSIMEIMDERGDKTGTVLFSPFGIAANDENNVFITNFLPSVLFKIEDAQLPVALELFEALVDGTDVHLLWRTLSETNNAGFGVERQRADGSWDQLGFLTGAGTTSLPQDYSYTIQDLAHGSHLFHLKQIDFDGSFVYSEQVVVNIAVQATHEIRPAFPNPFSHQTQFTLTLQKTQPVRVEVFNVLGQRVALLHEGLVEADNTMAFQIDGLNLASGVYMYKVTGGSFTESGMVSYSK